MGRGVVASGAHFDSICENMVNFQQYCTMCVSFWTWSSRLAAGSDEVSSNRKVFEQFFRKLTCQFKIVSICAKSDFDFSVRNINTFGRILTQFTGLLRANTVAAKHDLLTERTGLGKSESVALRKNGP